MNKSVPSSSTELMSINKYTGDKIRYYRTRAKITQKKLAEKAHCSVQQIGYYENSLRQIPSGVLFCISKFLRVPYTRFFPEQTFEDYEVARWSRVLGPNSVEHTHSAKNIIYFPNLFKQKDLN